MAFKQPVIVKTIQTLYHQYTITFFNDIFAEPGIDMQQIPVLERHFFPYSFFYSHHIAPHGAVILLCFTVIIFPELSRYFPVMDYVWICRTLAHIALMQVKVADPVGKACNDTCFGMIVDDKLNLMAEIAGKKHGIAIGEACPVIIIW